MARDKVQTKGAIGILWKPVLRQNVSVEHVVKQQRVRIGDADRRDPGFR